MEKICFLGKNGQIFPKLFFGKNQFFEIKTLMQKNAPCLYAYKTRPRATKPHTPLHYKPPYEVRKGREAALQQNKLNRVTTNCAFLE